MGKTDEYTPEFVMRGGTGTVYMLNEVVAVKIARSDPDAQQDHANEQAVFRRLEGDLENPTPGLIQCFLQVPGFTFLKLAIHGSLAMYLNARQDRDPDNMDEVWMVWDKIPTSTAHKWMRQLCGAAAGLESMGMCHGDIHLGNVLLDSGWNAILADLDRAGDLGSDLEAVSEPFGRLLNASEGEGAGTYGKASAYTETFALGSICYTLQRGHVPWETERWGPDHDVVLQDMFQNKQFPPLTDSREDTITWRCWNGGYSSVRELWEEFGGDGRELKDVSACYLQHMRVAGIAEECRQILDSGILSPLKER